MTRSDARPLGRHRHHRSSIGKRDREAIKQRDHTQKARELLERLELVYTPKHGSWLNMAEIEFSVLARQCLDRRIEDRDELDCQIGAWQGVRNESTEPVRWRFTTDDARIKLKHLYPSVL